MSITSFKKTLKLSRQAVVKCDLYCVCVCVCVCSVGVLGPKNADGQYTTTTTVADAAIRGRGRAACPVKTTAAAAPHSKPRSTSARMSTFICIRHCCAEHVV